MIRIHLYCFYLKDTAATEIYTYGHTLSLHDARPICRARWRAADRDRVRRLTWLRRHRPASIHIGPNCRETPSAVRDSDHADAALTAPLDGLPPASSQISNRARRCRYVRRRRS